MLFHIYISLGLIIFQTTIIPDSLLRIWCYDLAIPFILFLSIFRPPYESIIITAFLGIAMDSLSGGPFGLYGTTYLWLFVGARWAIQFLHINDMFVFPLLTGVGVLIENFIFLGAFGIFNINLLTARAVSIIAGQILMAIITGPLLMLCFYYLHQTWKKWLNQIFEKEDE